MADIDNTPVTVNDMLTLAKRLRSFALWEVRDGYYTTDQESAVNRAVRESVEAVATEIDSVFGFDSHITQEEAKADRRPA